MVIVEANYQIEYCETNADEHLGFDVGKEEDVVTRRRSMFPRYDVDRRVPILITLRGLMIIDNSKMLSYNIRRLSVKR